MPWPVHPTSFLGARGDSDTYRIERSLRFNSADSAYLNRTPASAGNRKTWTWSGWVKTHSVGIPFFSAGDGTTSNRIMFFINSPTEQLYISSYTSGVETNLRVTTQVFRDPSSWYHLVVGFDTTQATASDRIKIYINGSQVTSFSTQNNLSQNADSYINNNIAHRLGNAFGAGYFEGYLTEIH